MVVITEYSKHSDKQPHIFRKQINNLNSRETSKYSDHLNTLNYQHYTISSSASLLVHVEMSYNLTSRPVYDCFKDIALARRLRNIPLKEIKG
jgi:hypothetical protein